MIRSKYIATMQDGVKVDMLFTLSLFAVAKKRKIALKVEDKDDTGDRLLFFVKLAYLGGLNAWEYKSIDNPEIGEFPWSLLDFAEWSGSQPGEFKDMILGASAAITGKEVEADSVDEAADKVSEVKKKSFLTGIIRRLRRS